MVFLLGCGKEGNHVEIVGSKGSWQLKVNGNILKLKGVGVGQAKSRDNKINFLQMAKEMGANSVRTWGVKQADKEYLKNAKKYGLFLNAGIWLNQTYKDGTCSYITDEKCIMETRNRAIEFVKKNMSHPSILFWGVGNETIYWTKDEKERIAFAKFLEELIQDIHKIDPHHPVVYTTSYTVAVDYIKQYVPSLDIIGLNVYGGFDYAHKKVISTLDIPYIISEFGPVGPWDRGKDVNGKPIEMTDELKTHDYKRYAHKIKAFDGYCLGSYVFFLGDTTQVSFTWWNLNHENYKKLSYLTMKQIYTGEQIAFSPPNIRRLALSKTKSLKPGEEFTINAIVKNPNSESFDYSYFASTDIEVELQEFPNKRIELQIEGNGTHVIAKAPLTPGIYRIYVVATDEANGTAGTLNKTIRVLAE